MVIVVENKYLEIDGGKFILLLEEEEIDWLLFVLSKYEKEDMFDDFIIEYVDDNYYINYELKEIFEKMLGIEKGDSNDN